MASYIPVLIPSLEDRHDAIGDAIMDAFNSATTEERDRMLAAIEQQWRDSAERKRRAVN